MERLVFFSVFARESLSLDDGTDHNNKFCQMEPLQLRGVTALSYSLSTVNVRQQLVMLLLCKKIMSAFKPTTFYTRHLKKKHI